MTLDYWAECSVSTFVYNMKLGGLADAPESCAAIQRDLDRLEECADRSLMESNQGIWQVLLLGRNSPRHGYRLELIPGKALGVLVDLLQDSRFLSENQRMVWVGRDVKDHPVPPLPSWAEMPPTRSGCSGGLTRLGLGRE
ncbi:hypothetical protein BTVI_157166 [Pitangus sulphuratus]|nr:hypothetical protein BTVI_157166 [Pitangus sulphuratus]